MEDEEYIWKNVKETTKIENGEEKTVSVLEFAMTPESIEYRDEGESNKIKLDSIKKIYHGKRPYPEKLHLVLENGREKFLPEWILEDFEGLPETISKYAGLVKTEGPELETKRSNKVKRFTGLSLGIFMFALIVFVGAFGAIAVLSVSPCCFGPIWMIGLLAMIWLAWEFTMDKEMDKHVWERPG